MDTTFGRLIINDHGKRLIQDNIDVGMSEEQATLLVNGQDAVWLALEHCPWPQAPSEQDLRDHLANYIPAGYQIAFERGNLVKDYVIIDQILTVPIAKDILPVVTKAKVDTDETT